MSDFFIRPLSDGGYYFTKTGERVVSKYSHYTCKEDYEKDGVQYIVPMSAYEAPEEKIEDLFNSNELVVDEKIDGIRAIMHILENGEVRVFSRGVSKVTGWLGENTDRLPQFQCMDIPESLYGTILDGELVIPGFDCGTISGCMNALPELAIDKQYHEHGFAVYKAFDIIELCNRCTRELPLLERRYLLDNVVEQLDSEWVEHLKYFKSGKKEYYEEVVKAGGEGVMLKHINGIYEHKKGRHYQKVKAKLTRDLIISGFTPPTKEYTGKFPNDHWDFWLDKDGNKVEVEDSYNYPASTLVECCNTPVTKHYYNDQVGNIRLAVLSPAITTNKMKLSLLKTGEGIFNTIDCGECAGISDEDRRYLTDNSKDLIGSVVEVECNEIFRDTGKMRHPRFKLVRTDKSFKDCTWDSHIE